jgi:hypothetical protein
VYSTIIWHSGSSGHQPGWQRGRPDTVDRAAPDRAAPGLRSAQRVRTSAAAAPGAGINPDPAWDYKGLLWDYRRMGLPQGWRETAGSWPPS